MNSSEITPGVQFTSQRLSGVPNGFKSVSLQESSARFLHRLLSVPVPWVTRAVGPGSEALVQLVSVHLALSPARCSYAFPLQEPEKDSFRKQSVPREGTGFREGYNNTGVRREMRAVERWLGLREKQFGSPA